MSKWKGIAMSAVLMIAWTTPALAAKSAGLAPGGRTLAGPASSTVAVNATVTVFSNGNRNACATLLNVGKSAVRLATIGGNTSTIDVPAGGSGALCKASLAQVDLTCIGLDTCSAQWRVDDN